MKKHNQPGAVLFLIITIITIAAHVLALIVIPYYKEEKQTRGDTSVFKVVDVTEYTPPPPPAEKQEEVIKVIKQEKITEDVIETEKDVVEIPEGTGLPEQKNAIEYLPQYKISKLPELPLTAIKTKIEYPPMARMQGIEGIVYLMLYIDQTGVIRKIEVLKDPGYGFKDAAVNALDGINCAPAEANGLPVAIKYRYAIRFTLN